MKSLGGLTLAEHGQFVLGKNTALAAAAAAASLLGALYLLIYSYSQHMAALRQSRIPLDLGDHNNLPSMGNILAGYIYDLSLDHYHGQEFHWQSDYRSYLGQFPFIELLPKRLPYDRSIGRALRKIPSIESILKFPRGSTYLWVVHNNDHHALWQAVRGKMHTILDTTLASAKLKPRMGSERYPIIHWRCSDVPFLRFNEYHFALYAFYLESLRAATERGIDTTTVMVIGGSSQHGAKQRSYLACAEYLNALIEFLRANGYPNVFISDNNANNVEDFGTLFYAPAVISAGSSFSFLAGYLGCGSFFSAGHFYEIDGKFSNECDECSAWLFPTNFSLLHRDVVDYYNTHRVIAQLQGRVPDHLVLASLHYYTRTSGLALLLVACVSVCMAARFQTSCRSTGFCDTNGRKVEIESCFETEPNISVQ